MFLSELKIWNFRKYRSGDGGASGSYLGNIILAGIYIYFPVF